MFSRGFFVTIARTKVGHYKLVFNYKIARSVSVLITQSVYEISIKFFNLAFANFDNEVAMIIVKSALGGLLRMIVKLLKDLVLFDYFTSYVMLDYRSLQILKTTP